jgi:type IV pilus assembly protein PilC
MKMFPNVFPPILINMIEAGEATGKLDEVLDRMSVHFTKENAINNKVKSAMIYPIVLLSLTVIVVGLLMVVVVPEFTGAFEDAGMELPMITRIVLGFSNSLASFWYLYLMVIGGFVLWFRTWLKTEGGRYKFDGKKLTAAVIGTPVKQIVTARFTRTLATLLESGIPVVKALTIAAETTNNVVVAESVGNATSGIKRGMSLTGELRKGDIFPQMMLSMVNIGEESGNLDALLLKVADYYDEELDAGIARLLALMEPALIIVMGLIIGSVVIAIMLPMMAMGSGDTMDLGI